MDDDVKRLISDTSAETWRYFQTGGVPMNRKIDVPAAAGPSVAHAPGELRRAVRTHFEKPERHSGVCGYRPS